MRDKGVRLSSSHTIVWQKSSEGSSPTLPAWGCLTLTSANRVASIVLPRRDSEPALPVLRPRCSPPHTPHNAILRHCEWAEVISSPFVLPCGRRGMGPDLPCLGSRRLTSARQQGQLCSATQTRGRACFPNRLELVKGEPATSPAGGSRGNGGGHLFLAATTAAPLLSASAGEGQDQCSLVLQPVRGGTKTFQSYPLHLWSHGHQHSPWLHQGHESRHGAPAAARCRTSP